MDTTERRSPNLSLLIFRVPRYRYFPTNQMSRCGPEQWERLWIWQACERLEIPTKLWPKWAFPNLPRNPQYCMSIPNRPEKFNLPPFNPLVESIAEWRQHCHAAFDKTLDEYTEKFQAQFQDAVKRGSFTKLPRTRDTTPSDLRYEWAAQRICYRTPYNKLAKSGYSAERIKQSVIQTLKKAGWKEGI
jgi:hypothetical protein